MRVAVISPYHGEPDDWLAQCHASVRAQTHSCEHIFVADGRPSRSVEAMDAQHIIVRRAHGDFGDTPRALGAISAIGQGFDAVAFLDADNWYKSTHIESLVDLQRQSGAAIATSGRALYDQAGEFLGACPLSDGEAHVDSNCYLLTRPAFGVILGWALMPHDLHVIGDRIVLNKIIGRGIARAHSWRASLCYRASTVEDYWILGQEPPPDVVRQRRDTHSAFETLRQRGGPDFAGQVSKGQAKANLERTIVEVA